MSATGYAVKSRAGQILIRTVSDTERAAKINWLVAEREVMVFASATNTTIDLCFAEYAKEAGATVVRVVVAEASV